MPDMPMISGDPNSAPPPGGPPAPMPPPPLPPGGPTNPLDEAGQPSGPLELTPDQMDALSLADLSPGQSQTVVLKRQDAEGGGTGTTFEVVSSEPVQDDESAAPMDEPPAPEGPSEEEEPEAEPTSEDDMAGGYKRPKKAKREGLPDTKKMRSL